MEEFWRISAVITLVAGLGLFVYVAARDFLK